MEILCFGLSHHTAPVDVREKFAVGDAHLGNVTASLAQFGDLGEAVIISTCNRVEYYVAADAVNGGFDRVREFIKARGVNAEAAHFHEMPTQRAVRHLFRVVCGLDSMVLGETEILGQVKKAYQAAHGAGATSRNLNKLFQRAFNVAKEVRTKTAIQRGTVSIGSVAVDLAGQIFGDLSRCGVMILGAGEMADLTAGSLQARGVHAIFVTNRSYERAVALAEKMSGRAVHFDQWQNELTGVDILIGSTAAPHHVITAAQLAPLMHRREARPLLCIDLAVPRDIEPEVNNIESVYLYDIDHLQKVADDSMAERRQEVTLCEQIIDKHTTEFMEWLAHGGRAQHAPSKPRESAA